MNKKDVEKKILQAEGERNRMIEGVKTQKETAEKRKEELSSLLKNMDPAASFEEFKKVQTEAATNEAFLSHLESAERQLKEPTDAAKAEYKSIIKALQEDVDERHKKTGDALMEPLKKAENILLETMKEDDNAYQMQARARKAYAIPDQYRTQQGARFVYGAVESIKIFDGVAAGTITALYRISTLLQAVKDIEESRKKGLPF